MPSRMTRRTWMAGALGGALAMGPGGRGSLAARRPNFVFINVDDLAHDAMGFMGRYPFLETPNIDRLARESTVFQNAFVTISLCSPSRACSLTGCYAHRAGVKANEQYDPHPALPTYPQVLQRAGYTTAHVGKWHMQLDDSPRPGFDYWLSFRGQGEYMNPRLNENGSTFRAEGYMTDVLTDHAVRWIEGHDGDKPFCLNLWHKAVHGPFTPAPRHADAFPEAALPEPPGFHLDMSDRPEWVRRGMTYGVHRKPWEQSEGKPVPKALPPAQWDPRDKTRLDYLRAILAVDESLGRIFDVLERTGQLANTAIVFTSDNGFFLGEHRRGDKRLAHEPSIRIPLILRLPGTAPAGARLDAMALHIDVAPTLLELAGAPIPETMQGRSLEPLLEGTAEAWRGSFLYEYFQEAYAPGIPTMLAVRTQRWKYIVYPERPGQPEELYDLEADPHELKNLAASPGHRARLESLRSELLRLKEETAYGEPLRPRIHTEPALVFSYNFANQENGRIRDASGNAYHLTLPKHGWRQTTSGVAFEGGPEALPIRAAKSPDPAMKSFHIKARVTPAATGGAILALGGESHGFLLGITEGKPCLALRSAGNHGVLRAAESVETGEPVQIEAGLNGNGNMVLRVNGGNTQELPGPGFIPGRPNDPLSIAADAGSPVFDGPMPPWRGELHTLTLSWGDLDLTEGMGRD